MVLMRARRSVSERVSSAATPVASARRFGDAGGVGQALLGGLEAFAPEGELLPLEVEALGLLALLGEAQAGGVDLDGHLDDLGGAVGVAGEGGVVGQGEVGVGRAGVEGGVVGEALEFLPGGDGAFQAVGPLLSAHPRLPLVDGGLAHAQAVFGGQPGGEGGPGDALGALVGVPALGLGQRRVPGVVAAFFHGADLPITVSSLPSMRVRERVMCGISPLM